MRDKDEGVHVETSSVWKNILWACIGLYQNEFQRRVSKLIQMEADNVYTVLSKELKVQKIREDLVKEHHRKNEESCLTATKYH